MNKWIYIKSNKLVDAYAVATVLNQANAHSFNIVRRSRYAALFNGHSAVSTIDMFHNRADDELIEIEPSSSVQFDQLLIEISNKIGVTYMPTKQMYLPAIKIPEKILDANFFIMLSESKNIYQHLTFIGSVIDILGKQHFNAATVGTMAIPCLRNSIDFRNIFKWEYIPLISQHNKAFMLTNNADYHDLSIACGLRSILITIKEDLLYANDKILTQPEEMVNYIINLINL